RDRRWWRLAAPVAARGAAASRIAARRGRRGKRGCRGRARRGTGGSPWARVTRASPPDQCASLSSGRGLPLQADLGLEALGVAKDRGDRERAPGAAHAHEPVLGPDIALDREVVPALGMADIVDRNVVVLTPEERDRIERLAPPEHVERRRLSLPFRHDPMLDADGLAGEAIGPARDVAGGEDPGRARFEEAIDRDAAVGLEPGRLGEPDTRPHADAGDDEIGLENASVAQRHSLALDAARGVAQVEDDAVLLVNRLHEAAEIRTQDFLHRPLFRRDDMDLDISRA